MKHPIICMILLTLFQFIDVMESRRYTERSMGNISRPFSHHHIFNQLSPRNYTENQDPQHICTFDCIISIPFGKEFILPSDCHQEATSKACEVEVLIDFTTQTTVYAFYSDGIDLIINGTRINTYFIEVTNFEFSERDIYIEYVYKCSYNDHCELNRIKEDIPRIISTNYQILYDSLSRFIYDNASQTNAMNCYVSDNVSQCASGHCAFTQYLDPETYLLSELRECSLSGNPKIHFGYYRITPGPTIYDFDYLHYACNIDKCNGDQTEKMIKNVIGFPFQNFALKQKCFSYRFILFIFFTTLLCRR